MQATTVLTTRWWPWLLGRISINEPGTRYACARRMHCRRVGLCGDCTSAMRAIQWQQSSYSDQHCSSKNLFRKLILSAWETERHNAVFLFHNLQLSFDDMLVDEVSPVVIKPTRSWTGTCRHSSAWSYGSRRWSLSTSCCVATNSDILCQVLLHIKQ